MSDNIQDPDFTEVLKTHEEYIICLEKVLTAREITLELMHEIQKAIEESYNDSRIAKIAGSAGGIVGGGLGILGFALIPVTFRGSLALTVIGGIVGAAGAVTMVGADIGYSIVSRERMKYGKEVCDCDRENMQKLKELGEKYQQLLSELSKKYDTLEKGGKFTIGDVLSIPNFIYLSFKLGDAISDGFQIVRIGAGATPQGSIVSNVVGIPIDLCVLIKASYDVHQYQEKKVSKSKRARTVKDVIAELEAQKDKLVKELEVLKTSVV